MTSPDTIVVNADILTMVPLVPRAEALAITDERVSALGDSHFISALAGANTEIIDASGRLVLPGFQDTHLHLQDSGMNFALNVKLEGAHTVADLQRRIADFAAANPQRAWPMGSVERFAFYDLARKAYCVIATGETRFYGCFVFKKGVIPPGTPQG